MKFIVSKKRVSVTENRKPCDESVEEELTPLDYRTVKTLEEAKGKIWYKDWFEGGENHREEDWIVVCDRKEKTKRWVVAINTLEELMAFQSKYDSIVILDGTLYKECKKEIII